MLSDRINLKWYTRERAVEEYARDDQLEQGLVHILLRHRDAIFGQPVLDIGVGAGRTTLYLSRLTSDYVGIDYSQVMVDYCKRRFPALSIDLCDVRDLSRFPDARFSFALFSFNGLGAVDHEGRLKALAELARVLRPGGVFAFNAHNRRWSRAGAPPRLALSRNPVTQVHNVAEWVEQSWNHRKLRPFQEERPEYALINDSAKDYRLLHYYLTREQQKLQLEAAGFTLLEMYDAHGEPLGAADDDRKTSAIWYVARR
jgi:ubiquinone/menaquinone biosynthesis C-methylase UbiE